MSQSPAQIRSFVKSSMCGKMDPEKYMTKYSKHTSSGDELALAFFTTNIQTKPSVHSRYQDHIGTIIVAGLPLDESSAESDVFLSEPAQTPNSLLPPQIEVIESDQQQGEAGAKLTAPEEESSDDSDSDSDELTPEQFDATSIQSLRIQVAKSEEDIARLQAKNPSNFFAYKKKKEEIKQWATALTVF